MNDEHSGDVIDTSSKLKTDADGDTLTVASVRTGNSEGSGTAGTVGSALTGTYGQLTLNANGSYTYVANQSAADDLDAGDVVYDYFNYTVSDGNGGTDIAVITITVIGINDTPVAVNDTDSVVEDGSVTKTGSEDDVLTMTQMLIPSCFNSYSNYTEWWFYLNGYGRQYSFEWRYHCYRNLWYPRYRC